jgi:hypothetical protein
MPSFKINDCGEKSMTTFLTVISFLFCYFFMFVVVYEVIFALSYKEKVEQLDNTSFTSQQKIALWKEECVCLSAFWPIYFLYLTFKCGVKKTSESFIELLKKYQPKD